VLGAYAATGSGLRLGWYRNRLRLFKSINQYPTLYEVVTGKQKMNGREYKPGRKRPEPVSNTSLPAISLVACTAILALLPLL
jgi:hypothetical protein